MVGVVNLHLFQSTLPLRGATQAGRAIRHAVEFQSTLPLRGATWSTGTSAYGMRDFNPHSPCGERPGSPYLAIVQSVFQSTLPLRGATTALKALNNAYAFQSTLPLRGATCQVRCRVK